MGCPGSAAYRKLGNGQIEVNGYVPIFRAEYLKEKLRRTWRKFGQEILAAGRAHSVPPAWLLGILMQESSGGEVTCSPCTSNCCSHHGGRSCCAFGIMQFTEPTAHAFGTNVESLLDNSSHALERAAALLASHLRKVSGDPVKAFTLYNAGRLRCEKPSTTFGYVTNGDYPMNVIRWSNTALSIDLGRPSSVLPILVSVGIMSSAYMAAKFWKQGKMK